METHQHYLLQAKVEAAISEALIATLKERPADPITAIGQFLIAKAGTATDKGTVLAFALGGSSDVIGALACARAMGFSKIVLVQPGSPGSSTRSSACTA